MTAKLCKDCYHYTRTRAGLFDACDHPTLISKSVVTGEIRPASPELARTSSGRCGPEATLFVPVLPEHPRRPRTLFERIDDAVQAFKEPS